MARQQQANFTESARDSGHKHEPWWCMPIADLIQKDRFASSVIRDLLVHARQPGVISLAGGLPAESALPVERFGDIVAELLSTRGPQALQYGLSAGEPELQALIAAAAPHPTDPDNIVVTAGSQQALDLVFRVLAADEPERNVAVVEDPGYLGALQALRAQNYSLAPVPVDGQGLNVEHLEQQLLAGLRPRLCYTNPAFQNPTGCSLSEARATRLVELAEEYNFVIVADDPYVELFLDGERPAPLPPSEMVVHLGSVSKTLSPGLRVGWLNAHVELASVVALAKQPADLQTSTINQLAVAALLADTRWWTKHTDALRSDYRLRRDTLLRAVRSHLGAATVLEQNGGFFLWLTLPEDANVDGMALLPAAIQNGVAFVPGSAFAVAQGQANSLRLSYSSGDPANFDEAVRRLAATIAAS